MLLRKLDLKVDARCGVSWRRYGVSAILPTQMSYLLCGVG